METNAPAIFTDRESIHKIPTRMRIAFESICVIQKKMANWTLINSFTINCLVKWESVAQFNGYPAASSPPLFRHRFPESFFPPPFPLSWFFQIAYFPPTNPHFWNQYEAAQEGTYKTNNLSEGWQNRFQCLIGKHMLLSESSKKSKQTPNCRPWNFHWEEEWGLHPKRNEKWFTNVFGKSQQTSSSMTQLRQNWNFQEPLLILYIFKTFQFFCR